MKNDRPLMNKWLLIILMPFLTHAQAVTVEAEELIQRKQYQESVQILELYLVDHPGDMGALELLGDSYGYLEKWDKAIPVYKLLVGFDDSNANYHYKYGGAIGMKALSGNKFSALWLVDDIKREFLRAAELDAEHIETRWALVELYMQLPGILGGSREKSLSYADELEALSPVDGYLAKGYIYEYDGEPEKAEYYYKQAIEIGGSVNCFQKLTHFYESEDKPDKAIETIERANDIHHRNAMHYQIGKVCAQYNVQLEKGVNCLKSFITNHSVKDGIPIEWAYYRLAQIYRHMNDKSKALESISRSLNHNPGFKLATVERETILQM